MKNLDHMVLGKRFGSWTVLERTKAPVGSAQHSYFLCRCDCGATKPVLRASLVGGFSKRCQACQRRNRVRQSRKPTAPFADIPPGGVPIVYREGNRVKTRFSHQNDLSGQRFGKWLVLRGVARATGRPNAHATWKDYWLCRCDCSREVPVTVDALQAAIGSVCDGFHRLPASASSGGICPWVWTSIRKGAKRRGLVFEVTLQGVLALFDKQNQKCALSGLPLVMAKTGSVRDASTTTASLDRIDSTKGYTPDNVQWIHKEINRMKGCLSDPDFIALCTKVGQHRGSEACLDWAATPKTSINMAKDRKRQLVALTEEVPSAAAARSA